MALFSFWMFAVVNPPVSAKAFSTATSVSPVMFADTVPDAFAIAERIGVESVVLLSDDSSI